MNITKEIIKDAKWCLTTGGLDSWTGYIDSPVYHALISHPDFNHEVEITESNQKLYRFTLKALDKTLSMC